MADASAEDFLPLTPLSFHILMALARGRAHGYAVGEAIERTSGGTMAPTTGSLYQALKRLRDEGLLEEAPAPPDASSGGPPRMYFRLTPLGRAVVRLEAGRLDGLLDIARETDLLPARSSGGAEAS